VHAVTSFHAAGVEPENVRAVTTGYLALQRAQVYRRLFVTRFGLLAALFGLAGFGFHWLTSFATWTGVALCAVAPTWAWVTELRCDWRLTERLNALPHGAAAPASTTKVIKSS
jgi:hypothetical protein